MQNVISQERLCEQIIATLGANLTKQDIQGCLKGLEIIEPEAIKLFWQVYGAKPGIFIVLAGKVRLLDDSDNLIATVPSGASFSEQSLFSEQNYINFAARASTSLKLCFIDGKVIHSLMSKYPQIRERMKQRAEFWDLLVLFRQNARLSRNSSIEAIWDLFN